MANSLEPVFKALANDKRLQVLDWLKDPKRHFPPQVDGDLEKDGVCAIFLTEKLGVSQPTAAQHLKSLVQAELLVATRIRQWTFYRRNEARIDAIKALIREHV